MSGGGRRAGMKRGREGDWGFVGVAVADLADFEAEAEAEGWCKL